jgi:hypothetical protein
MCLMILTRQGQHHTPWLESSFLDPRIRILFWLGGRYSQIFLLLSKNENSRTGKPEANLSNTVTLHCTLVQFLFLCFLDLGLLLVQYCKFLFKYTESLLSIWAMQWYYYLCNSPGIRPHSANNHGPVPAYWAMWGGAGESNHSFIPRALLPGES